MGSNVTGLVVAFSLLVRILGECSTIHSLPVLLLLSVLKWRLAHRSCHRSVPWKEFQCNYLCLQEAIYYHSELLLIVATVHAQKRGLCTGWNKLPCNTNLAYILKKEKLQQYKTNSHTQTLQVHTSTHWNFTLGLSSIRRVERKQELSSLTVKRCYKLRLTKG